MELYEERTWISSFLFLAMIFCCSVLYGLLRLLRRSRAWEFAATLAAREAALDATMMIDMTVSAGLVEKGKRKCTKAR